MDALPWIGTALSQAQWLLPGSILPSKISGLGGLDVLPKQTETIAATHGKIKEIISKKYRCIFASLPPAPRNEFRCSERLWVGAQFVDMHQ